MVQLRFTLTEIGQKKVSVHLIDADGQDLIPPMTGDVLVNKPPLGVLESTVRLVMEFGNVEFKNYGNFSVKMNVDGQELVSIPLRVAQPPRTA